MTPYAEPDTIPSLFNDRVDWRGVYTAYVEEYKTSAKTVSDEVLLTIRLKRLGFVGVRLQDELAHIKQN